MEFIFSFSETGCPTKAREPSFPYYSKFPNVAWCIPNPENAGKKVIDFLKNKLLISLRLNGLSVGIRICWLYPLQRVIYYQKIEGVQDITGDRKSVEYPFFAISPRSTLTKSLNTF